MGEVTFGIPESLAALLVQECALLAAVETGTYLGSSALLLRRLVPDVWTIEIDPKLHASASAKLANTPGVIAKLGESRHVLPALANEVSSPALFWLDGHGGTLGAHDLPQDIPECPVLEEISAINDFPCAPDACILIDDARAFFGPMPRHRNEEWPTFLEVADALRTDVDRYVTALDDVIIAVPSKYRHVVDNWWLNKLMASGGKDSYQLASDPTPARAARQLIRSLTPQRALKARRLLVS